MHSLWNSWGFWENYFEGVLGIMTKSWWGDAKFFFLNSNNGQSQVLALAGIADFFYAVTCSN
jgi:hypothetical protein